MPDNESKRLAEENVFGSTPQQWAMEAAEAEEKRHRAEHGPEDAPPKPAWPVWWCEECSTWSPTNASHGHMRPGGWQ